MRKGRIYKSEKSENNLAKGIKIVDLHKEKLKKEREERQKMLSDENLKQIQKWDWKNQGEKYKEFFERNIKK